jgi:nucleotide-binding universal stress UspA family protein
MAAAIARRGGAHVIGAALSGVSRFLYQSMPSEANDPTLALHLEFLRERARDALALFARQMDAGGVASYESRLIDDEAGAGVSLHARAADLVVVGQADPGPAALPLMARADSVTVAVFDTRSGNRSVADAVAADPVPFLQRHGIRAELSIVPVEQKRGHRRHEVGEALLTLAGDKSSDLLVMGAYGHSRFRETILGGATRTVLETMTIPVLMAH